MSTSSSYSCMYNYPTMSIFDHPSDPNLTTSYLHGWARRLVSATFKPMVQWLMYLVSVAKLLLGWLCIVLKIMTLFVGWSIPGGLINAAPVAAGAVVPGRLPSPCVATVVLRVLPPWCGIIWPSISIPSGIGLFCGSPGFVGGADDEEPLICFSPNRLVPVYG